MATERSLYIRIYTDEDVLPSLASALRQRGYIAESAHESGMLGRSDADQREHAGIILSEQMDRQRFGDLLRQALRLLNTLTADDLHNSVVYLQHFR